MTHLLLRGLFSRPARSASEPAKSVRLLAALIVLGSASFGCGGDKGSLPESGEGDPSLQRVCLEAGPNSQSLDADQDGRPDIRHVFNEGNRRICSEFDLNRDGNVDVTRFYAADGEATVREQHDLDFDGQLDQITHYEGSEVVRRELDTNFDNVLDAWVWCKAGLIERAERDRRNTGKVDTWEDYEAGYLVSVSYDDNNDGKPEKWEVFRAGRLAELRYDTDDDGRPDQHEEISAEEAGPRDEQMRCDGKPLPAQRAAAPEEPTPPAAPADEDATSEDSASGDSPFGAGTGTDTPIPGSENGPGSEAAAEDASETLPGDDASEEGGAQ